MSEEEDERRMAAEIVLNQDLDKFSIEELEKRITLLEAEIVRIRNNINQKRDTKLSAENFFKT